MHDDTLILFGGAAKALDDAGRFGGPLVLFGDAEHTDISSFKDYFGPDTDYWTDFPRSMPLLYAHGRNPEVGLRRLATVTVKAEDADLWLEGQLDLREKYERKIWEMVKAGKLGLSSGSAGHLVERKEQSNGTHKIVSWPLVEASLTPTPAEPRILVHALKSLPIGDGAAPASKLVDSLDSLVSDARGLLPWIDRAVKARADEGRHLSPEKLEAVKAVHAEFGRLIAAAEAPDPEADMLRRKVEARKGLERALLRLALTGI